MRMIKIQIEIIIWLALLFLIVEQSSFNVVFDGMEGKLVVSNWFILYGSLFNLFLYFIFSYHFLPQIKKSQYSRRVVAYCLLFFIAVTALECIIDWFYYSHHQIKTFYKWPDAILATLLLNFLFVFLAVLVHSVKAWIVMKKMKKALELENINTQMKFLRSQINPHFLFNTLNNLYAEALKENSSKTAKGIAKLSYLMRYLVYESSADKITLAKEIEFIESYISLEKMRFADSEIDFEIVYREAKKNIFIAPLILQPLIENAFKHGVKPEVKSFIHIEIKTEAGILNVIIKNSNYATRNSNDENNGVGLMNVKKRLDLLYPGKHIFKIEEYNEEFEVNLSIHIEDD